MTTGDLVGKRVGKYYIRQHIARGGMADVYLAQDTHLDRFVALKVMLGRFSKDRDFVRRFLREARAMAKLNHPNIIQVFDYGTMPADSRPYIAMQYVKGGALSQWLKQLARQGQYLPSAQILWMMQKVAEALTVAHNAGIVHRDLKPSNILIEANGNPILADLGLAFVPDGTQLTNVESWVGTPDYMSPEQIRGKRVDGRSDIYAMGVILFEMLSGRRPFAGDTQFATMHQHLHEVPPTLSQLRGGLQAITYRIVETCLQKDPNARFQNIQQLVTALHEASALEQGKTPSSVSGLTGTPRQSSQKGQYAVFGIIALVLIIAGIFLFGGGDEPQNPNSTSTRLANVTQTPLVTPTNVPVIVDPLAPVTTTVVTANSGTVEVTEVIEDAFTPEETSDVTPTSGNPTGNPGQGGGLPLGFEAFGLWVRGNEANGTFEQSTTRTRTGRYAGLLRYDFRTADNDYVVFMQNNTINGSPNSIQAWVHGDGSGHFLNAWIVDNEGQTWQVPLGRVSHQGWRLMTGFISTNQAWPWTHISGSNNNRVDYPIRFRGLVLDDAVNAFSGQGEIYIDDLTALTTVAQANTPTPRIFPTNTPRIFPTNTPRIFPTNTRVFPTNTPLPFFPTNTPFPRATNTPVPTAPPAIGSILYTSGSTLLTTGPGWSEPREVGTVVQNSCSTTATTVTGDAFTLYRAPVCGVPGVISTCPAPDRSFELVVNPIDANQVTINVRMIGDQTSGQFIYQGNIDRDEGIHWSPLSTAFFFVVNDTIIGGSPASPNFTELALNAQDPAYSPDGRFILYRTPVGPGVTDVFVMNAGGGGMQNVTNISTIDKRCVAWVR